MVAITDMVRKLFRCVTSHALPRAALATAKTVLSDWAIVLTKLTPVTFWRCFIVDAT
jgi:hypothetical protein